MLFKDPNHLIGVDIRTHDIIAIELTGTQKHCRLKRMEHITLPKTADGTAVSDPVIIADTLTRLFGKGHFGTRNVALSISGFGITVKNLPVKRVEPTLLHDRIMRIAEQYVPYPLAGMYMDYMVLGNSVHQPGQMDVLLVAAPKSLVDGQLKAVKMANLIPVIVDVAPLSAVNCYAFNDDTASSAILLAVDANSVAITTVADGLLRFTRHVDMDVSAQPDASELARVLYETTDRLLESDLPQDVSKVYLYGSVPQLEVLKKALAREVTLDVALFNPFGNITLPARLKTLESQSLLGPQATIGVGLALRKGGS